MNQIARTHKQFGSAIRRARKSAGMTQQELGKKAGLRQATISDVETGVVDTSLKTLMDILAVLDLELMLRPRSKGSHDDFEGIF